MKILVCGHARHGKDTFADYISEITGMKSMSSSLFGLRNILYPALKEKYGYKSEEECYEDRMTKRELWYEMLCDYNKDDQARLAKSILAENDIYVGMRSGVEFHASKNLFDMIIWVDASLRKPKEESKSNTVEPQWFDYHVSNNGSLKEFKKTMNKFIIKNILPSLPWYKRITSRIKMLYK